MKSGRDANPKDKPEYSDSYSIICIDEKGKAQYSCENTGTIDGKAKGKTAYPDDEKRQARNRYCLAFMAGSGVAVGAEELQFNEGKQASSNDSVRWLDCLIRCDQ